MTSWRVARSTTTRVAPNSRSPEAAPTTDAEQREMLEAERKGKARAKGKKPPRE